jgi:hypothetical protein
MGAMRDSRRREKEREREREREEGRLHTPCLFTALSRWV